MTSADLRRKTAVALYRKDRASSAPRTRAQKEKPSLSVTADRRRQKAQTVVALMERYIEEMQEQDLRWQAGLSWAPGEGRRSAYHAKEILDELVEGLRKEDQA